jgi:hypothetical protein
MTQAFVTPVMSGEVTDKAKRRELWCYITAVCLGTWRCYWVLGYQWQWRTLKQCFSNISFRGETHKINVHIPRNHCMLKTRLAVYVERYIEARSRNHCCCGKAITITYWSVCACLRVRACVHMCMWIPGRVDVCMRIDACSLANSNATRVRHIVTSFVAPRPPPNFSTLSHKRCDFRKKFILHKCVFWVSL